MQIQNPAYRSAFFTNNHDFMGAFGMILEIILPLFKKKTRKDFHTKFGTMSCDFGKEDQYFYWHIYTDRFNKNKYSTSLWIEGTQIKPDEILLEISDNRTAIENMEIFNYIFFRRIGFKHEDDTVTIKENALITKVLESKKGNIFTIPICYFILARQSGLPVYPVIAGKSFTPAYLNSDDKPIFYINIYKNGIIFSRELTEPENPSRVGVDKALVSIYADHLNYLFKSINDKESSDIMERVLECFGNLRYIN